MSVIITLLLSALAILLVLIFVALVTPVRFEIRFRKDAETSYQVVARPFGGIGPPLPLADSHKKPETKEPRPAKVRKPEKDKRRWAGRGPGVILALPEFVKGLLRCIHIRSLSLDAEFGLNDPADTGYVYGMLTPIIYGNPWPRRATVSVRPVFGRALLIGVLDAKIDVTPITLAMPFLRLGWRIYGPLR